MEAIRTEKLTKYYGKARGIIDVDLNVEKGDFYGFIGPNGAGKSTTIRTLLGLIGATSGRAEIFGKDAVKYKTELLSDIGYLPSETSFYGGMKVSDIIEFSAKLRNKNCSDEAKILCERLELETSRKVGELSLGNRKKVGIVCALQHRPSLYILDEPTSGLDPLMQREFYSLLEERNKEGATVFLSSHVLSEVARYCKNAAIIKDGKILVSKSVRDLAHTGVKRVFLRNAKAVPELDSIRDVRRDGDTVSFLYSGESKSLIRELSLLEFDDVTVTNTHLEEVVMHYYAKEEK